MKIILIYKLEILIYHPKSPKLNEYKQRAIRKWNLGIHK